MKSGWAGSADAAAGASWSACELVPSLRRHRPSGPDHVDGEHHSHLAVPDDGAPAIESAAHELDLDAPGLAGGEPAAVLSGLEGEVVHVAVAVDHLDDEPVAGGHVDRGRVEAHGPRLDPHRGRLPGRVRACRRRCCGAERRRVKGGAHRDREDDGRQADCRETRVPGAHLSARLRDVPDRAGGHKAAGRPPPLPQGEGQQDEEGGVSSQDQQRDQHAHEAGGGQQEQDQPQVGGDGPGRAAPLQHLRRGAHGCRATPAHDGEQVGQRPQQDLDREPARQGNRDRVGGLARGRPVGGHGEQAGQPGQRHGQPEHGREDRPRGIRLGRTRPGRGKQRPQRPQCRTEVSEHRHSRDEQHAGERGGNHSAEGGDKSRKRLPGLAFGALDHLRAQDGGPEGQEGPEHREPHPAEDVGGDVRHDEPPVDGPLRVSREEGAEGRAHGEGGRGGDVVAHRCPEP